MRRPPPPLPWASSTHNHTIVLLYDRLQVASKPVESMDEITRPAKRSKGSSSSSSSSSSAGAAAADQQQQEEEEDVEMVGTKGGSELPHNRFTCPQVGYVESTNYIKIGRVTDFSQARRVYTADVCRQNINKIGRVCMCKAWLV